MKNDKLLIIRLYSFNDVMTCGVYKDKMQLYCCVDRLLNDTCDKIAVKEIMIYKPELFKKTKEVKEYLTNESFNYIMRKNNKLKIYNDDVSSFVLGGSYYKIPSSYDINEYVKKHSDVVKYKKELQDLKKQAKKYYLEVFEEEKQEDYIADVTRQLLQVSNDSKIISMCLDIIDKFNIQELKNNTIDELINRIHIINPELSDDECMSIIIVLLKLQNKMNTKNKIKTYK